MNKYIIDARGKNCPIPLIMLRKEIKLSPGKSFKLQVDNDIAAENIKTYLTDNEIRFFFKKNGEDFVFAVNTKNDDELKNVDCEPEVKVKPLEKESGYAVCIKGDCMGSGSDELGHILIQAFINTLPEIDHYPTHIVFYNSGVKFALKGSAVINALKRLAENGVLILSCGACLNYFEQSENVGAGKISNMFEIMSVLSRADKVICP